MMNIKNLKKESNNIRNENFVSYNNKLLPIADKIFDNYKESFINVIEKTIRERIIEFDSKHMIFQVTSQVESICKDEYTITEWPQVRIIVDHIENKLIPLFEKQGYHFSYVYDRTDIFSTNFHIFWSNPAFLKCKIRNFLKFSE